MTSVRLQPLGQFASRLGVLSVLEGDSRVGVSHSLGAEVWDITNTFEPKQIAAPPSLTDQTLSRNGISSDGNWFFSVDTQANTLNVYSINTRQLLTSIAPGMGFQWTGVYPLPTGGAMAIVDNIDSQGPLIRAVRLLQGKEPRYVVPMDLPPARYITTWGSNSILAVLSDGAVGKWSTLHGTREMMIRIGTQGDVIATNAQRDTWYTSIRQWFGDNCCLLESGGARQVSVSVLDVKRGNLVIRRERPKYGVRECYALHPSKFILGSVVRERSPDKERFDAKLYDLATDETWQTWRYPTPISAFQFLDDGEHCLLSTQHSVMLFHREYDRPIEKLVFSHPVLGWAMCTPGLLAILDSQPVLHWFVLEGLTIKHACQSHGFAVTYQSAIK